MKVLQQQLVVRLALALCALVGGAPGAAAAPTDPTKPPDVSKSGTDGVGGIERAIPHDHPLSPEPGSLAAGGATAPVALTPPGTPDIGAWIDLGLGLAGLSQPLLSGSTNGTQGTVALDLTGAKPGASATLIIGLGAVNMPFKGGTLVPRPDLLLFGLPVGASGTLHLSTQLPPNLPSGLALFVQFWMPDNGAPKGFAASNGLELLIP